MGPTSDLIFSVIRHLQLDAAPLKAKAQVGTLVQSLWKLYHEKEAISITVNLALNDKADKLDVYDPYLFFDDAAFKSNKRQADLHSLRDSSTVSATEIEAEKNGIVYIPLASPDSTKKDGEEPRNLVGTLVNGAGLAMNTNDLLSLRLNPSSTHPQSPLQNITSFPTSSANFLDTGGKATSETIKTSFKLILSDPRVSVVFVNIFGGLTLCDMIAEGIILAFKEIGVNKPVVVRLRGTNEEKGQQVLKEANLPIVAVNDFEEAVVEVGRLANGGKA
jgi:succinyl-CoA synthetase alpha subunit